LAVFLVIGLAQRQSHYGRTDWASRLVRRQIGHAAKTTAGIWKVSQPDLEAILFRLPPTEVQQCLVVKVASLFALADAIAARRAAARARVERLTSALLAKAFRGELVAQDPNGEPAGTLLARLRAQRHAQPPATRRGRARRARETTA
jgi:type I restriction enzyme S subunit